MKQDMQLQPTAWTGTVRLAAIVTVLAVSAAALARATGISETVIVLAVIVGGFAASWVHSGRTVRAASRPAVAPRHRVTVVDVHRHAA